MSDLQSPTVLNPGVLIPVNPAIEDYMRGLLNHTDQPARTMRFVPQRILRP